MPLKQVEKTKGYVDIRRLKITPSAKFISFLMEQLFRELPLASSWEKILKKLKGKSLNQEGLNYLRPRNG